VSICLDFYFEIEYYPASRCKLKTRVFQYLHRISFRSRSRHLPSDRYTLNFRPRDRFLNPVERLCLQRIVCSNLKGFCKSLFATALRIPIKTWALSSVLLLVLGIRPLLPILKYKMRNKSLICNNFLNESLYIACNFNKRKWNPCDVLTWPKNWMQVLKSNLNSDCLNKTEKKVLRTSGEIRQFFPGFAVQIFVSWDKTSLRKLN